MPEPADCSTFASAPSATQTYVIVTPARNEGRAVEDTILSVIGQTLRPIEWVIVDDGSTDETADIIDHYSRKYAWITAIHRLDRGCRKPGTGVIAAFNEGYHALTKLDWEYVVKLDADLTLEFNYFERCLEQFDFDRRLGIGGGTVYEYVNGTLTIEGSPPFHIRGATKIYRRACWEALGGLVVAPGWDTLDEVKANMLHWKTRTFADIMVLQRRPTGSNDGVWRDYVKNGRANYISGYHPLFMVGKCLKRLFTKPGVVASLGLSCGYITGYLLGIPQVNDPGLIRYLRGQQWRYILGRDSIWK